VSATTSPRRRRAWIRHAIIAASLVFAACAGHGSRRDDDWAALILLPCMGLQLLGAAVSLGMAVIAWIRFDYRGAFGELGLTVLMLGSIPASFIVMGLFAPGGCE